MKVFHIIEESTDQQVIEILAPSAHDAIGIYIEHCTLAPWDCLTKESNGRLIWEFPTEYCIMQAATEHLIFAKWVDKTGLY